MTPEELNRTVAFIVQSQAQLVVSLEQYQEWSKGVLRELAADHHRIVELINLQSHRLDRYDDAMREQEMFQRQFLNDFRKEAREARRRHDEALAKLDQILGKLADREN